MTDDKARGETPLQRAAGRLRVGYLSADLRTHVIGRRLGPVRQQSAGRAHDVYVYDLWPGENPLRASLAPHVAAWRPAPVQVNFFGYPGSLGDRRLADYLLADRVTAPPEHAEHYAATTGANCASISTDLPYTHGFYRECAPTGSTGSPCCAAPNRPMTPAACSNSAAARASDSAYWPPPTRSIASSASTSIPNTSPTPADWSAAPA
jgi:hypothetical protein